MDGGSWKTWTSRRIQPPNPKSTIHQPVKNLPVNPTFGRLGVGRCAHSRSRNSRTDVARNAQGTFSFKRGWIATWLVIRVSRFGSRRLPGICSSPLPRLFFSGGQCRHLHLCFYYFPWICSTWMGNGATRLSRLCWAFGFRRAGVWVVEILEECGGGFKIWKWLHRRKLLRLGMWSWWRSKRRPWRTSGRESSISQYMCLRWLLFLSCVFFPLF